jgi:hypothetical protein
MVIPIPRPQFTLRALLVAMLVVGASFAWVAHNANLVRQRNAMRSGFDITGSCFLSFHDKLLGPEHRLPWLRRALGDEPIERLLYVANRDPNGCELSRARALFPEAEIREIRAARHPPGEPYKVFVRSGPPPRSSWSSSDHSNSSPH